MGSADRHGDPIVVTRAEDAWFASDLHLDDDHPRLTARFLDALVALAALPMPAPPRANAADSPALFLLGDIFEYWIGDDHPSQVAATLAAALSELAKQGWRIFLMRGNRDFLIGEAFAARCHARLLDEPALLEIAGERIVLVHGDAECLDDTRYQQWRQLSHSPAWQQQFLDRPIAERMVMARAARAASQANRQASGVAGNAGAANADGRVEGGGDLSPAAVADVLERLGASGLIHGHTHRPAQHRIARDRWRWVLSDWEVEPPRGDIVSLQTARCRRDSTTGA